MAVWRTKACELFGFGPRDYSFARAKIDLLSHLIAMAKQAGEDGDEPLLDRIAEYVCWMDSQTSDDLQSAVDLAFFLPLFRDPELPGLFEGRIPEELMAEKWHILMTEGDASE